MINSKTSRLTARRSPHGSADRNPADKINEALGYLPLPARERGSKPQNHQFPPTACSAAPRTGARIETSNRWADAACHSGCGSLPARERGSKRITFPALSRRRRASLPARERGSKRCPLRQPGYERPSLPARERGSKPETETGTMAAAGRVAPRAGARIETRAIGRRHPHPTRRSLPARGARIETSAWA